MCRLFRTSTSFMPKRVMSNFPAESFLSHSIEKHRRETGLGCDSENFLRGREFLENRGGREGISRFSVGNFFVSQSRKSSWENPLVLHESRISKKFLDKSGEGGREYQFLSSKRLCLTAPKKFVGEPFNISEKLGFRKLFPSEGHITVLR